MISTHYTDSLFDWRGESIFVLENCSIRIILESLYCWRNRCLYQLLHQAVTLTHNFSMVAL